MSETSNIPEPSDGGSDQRLVLPLGLEQQSIGRTNNHRGPRPTRIITDPKEIEKICLNQPRVSAKRMRESILRQNDQSEQPADENLNRK